MDDLKNLLKKEDNIDSIKEEKVDETSKFQEEIEFINNSKASIFHNNVDSKLEYLVSAIFKESNLFETYYKILVDFIKVALNEVRPNSVFWGDQMDINQYIKIKKIPYFDNSETKYIRGVVFKKSLLDRKMPWNLEKARILLFSSSIEGDFLQPNSDFGTFKSFIKHEQGYFKNVAKNIIKLQPNVILMEKSINRYVAEYLKNLNIMIFVKVKRSLIMKIARVSRCKIVNDFSKMDGLNPEEYIGKCTNVYVKKLGLLEQKQNEYDSDSSKDFLYIEGCNPLYGVTLTISGPDMENLIKLKSGLKSIFKIGRSWLLENSLITLDQTFGEEIKVNYFNKANLAKQLGQESFSYEKIMQNDYVISTKVNFIQGNINEIPDFAKNPTLIKDLERSLDQDGEESVLKKSKLEYFAEICGFPSVKEIAFYSKEDISLGAYLILKANSQQSRCVSCGKPRNLHVSLYFHGNTFIRISCDFFELKNKSPEKKNRKIDPKNITSYSKGRKSDISHYNSLTSGLYNSPLLRNNEIKLNSETNINYKRIDSDKGIFTKRKVSISPSQTPKNNKLAKRKAVLKSYIECSSCKKRLTTMKTLDHEYLEYSFAHFLKRLLQSSGYDKEDFKEMEENGANCVHAMNVRVFEYDGTIVKFYVGNNNIYTILAKDEFKEYKCKNKLWEEGIILKKKEEYSEIFERSLEKLAVLVECFKNDEDVNKAGLNEHLECLFKEIRKFQEEFKFLFFKEFEFQQEVEEIRVAISREIIAFFDVFFMVIRVNSRSQFLETYRKHLNSKKMDLLSSQENKTPEELVKFFLFSRKKDFFSEFVRENAKASACNYLGEKEGNELKKNMHLLDPKMKYSCEPNEYLFELEDKLVLQKKMSDLVARLFFEQQDNFRQKFKNDEAFQLKHLEIEFMEFLKLTAGQCIDDLQRREEIHLQLFVKTIVYKI